MCPTAAVKIPDHSKQEKLEFLINIIVSVLSPILFAIVREALSPGFSAGLPWELRYADNLVIMAGSLDEQTVKLERWKAELSAKGFKVNTKKTKIMISKPGAGPVQKTGKYPCSVCSKGVGSNSTMYQM